MFLAIGEQVESLRQSITRLVVGRAVSRWLAAVFVVAATLASIDYSLDLHDSGLRWLLSALFAAIVLLSFRILLRPAISYEPDQLDVARWIESTHPELSTRLSSSLEFLKRERRGESSDLQKRIIAETEDRLQQIDIAQSVSSKPFYRACTMSLAAASIWVAMALSSPDTTATCIGRLLMPWAEISWPSANRLKLVGAVSAVAKGSDLLVVVCDEKGTLPEPIMLEMRATAASGSESNIATRPMERRGEQAEFLIDNLQNDVQIRAIGGDDTSMVWHTIVVVDAPTVVQLQLLATPPAYANSPTKEVSSGSTVIRGTVLSLNGNADQKIAKAWIHLTSQRSGTNSFQLEVSDDFRHFKTTDQEPIILDSDVRLAIELFGTDGVSSGHIENHEIHVTADSPPVAKIISPEDNRVIGPNAVLEITASVEEDLGIHAATLVFHESNGAELVTIPIENARVGDNGQTILSFLLGAQILTSLSIEREFEYFASVTDSKDQTSNSASQSVRIISEEALLRSVAEELARIRLQLHDVYTDEQDAVASLRSLTDSIDPLSPTSGQKILQIEVEQSSVAIRLVADEGSIALSMGRLLETIQSNTLPFGELHTALMDWHATLQQLKEAELDRIEHAFRRFDLTREKRFLDTIPDDIDSVLAHLRRILDECSTFSNQQSFAESIRSVLKEQTNLRSKTISLTEQVFLGDANPIELAALRDDQIELANQLETVLLQGSPSESKQLHQRLISAEVVESMHTSAYLIDRERVVQASELQAEILRQIRRVLDFKRAASDTTMASDVDGIQLDSALMAIRASQLEALVTTTDLAKTIPFRRVKSRSDRMALVRLLERQNNIVVELDAITSQITSSATAEILAYTAAKAQIATKNIRAHDLSSTTLNAMSSVIESIDTLLDLSSPGASSADQAASPSHSQIKIAIALQEKINSRTQAVQREIAKSGPSDSTDRELGALADLEQLVLRIVSRIETDSTEQGDAR